MSGGGSTTSETKLPESVNNLMNVGSQQAVDLANVTPISSFGQSNVQGTAGLSNFQQWAQGQVGNLGMTPQNQQYAMQWLSAMPQMASQTPGSFAAATGQRPDASQQAINLLYNSNYANNAGAVPSQYTTAAYTPWQETAAASRTADAVNQAQQAAAGYGNIAQYASQSGNYSDLFNIAGNQSGYYDQVQQGLQNMPLMATGQNIQNSPALQAANQAFMQSILPGIENQSALAGLGRSTALTSGTAAAQAQYLLPLVQNELAQEYGANQLRYTSARDVGLQQAQAQERGLERTLGIGMEAGARAEQGIGRGTDVLLQGQNAQVSQVPQTMLAASQMLTTLGQSETSRALQEANAMERGSIRRTEAIENSIAILQSQGQQDLARQLEQATAEERALARGVESGQFTASQLNQMGAADTARQQYQYEAGTAQGELERSIQQQQLDAEYNDYLRRQALSETAVFTPFGQLIPSALPQVSSGSSGGLFK